MFFIFIEQSAHSTKNRLNQENITLQKRNNHSSIVKHYNSGRYVNRILSYKIAQFVGNAVGVYTSGHTGAGERVWRAQHGPACASTLTEPRSGDSKQGQDDTERSEVAACKELDGK